MKFYTPQIQLVKKVKKDETVEYLVHAVTYFDKTAYVADGWYTEDSELENTVGLVLKIKKDRQMPTIYQCVNPIIHTFNLGALPFEDGDIEIFLEVSTYGNARNKNKRKARKGKASTSGATLRIRPLENAEVEDVI